MSDADLLTASQEAEASVREVVMQYVVNADQIEGKEVAPDEMRMEQLWKTKPHIGIL